MLYHKNHTRIERVYRADQRNEPVCYWCHQKIDERNSLSFLLFGSNGFCSSCLEILENAYTYKGKQKGKQKRIQKKRSKEVRYMFAAEDSLSALWMRIFLRGDHQAAKALLEFLLEKGKSLRKIKKNTYVLADSRLMYFAKELQDVGSSCKIKCQTDLIPGSSALLLFENAEMEDFLLQNPLCKRVIVLQKLHREETLPSRMKKRVFHKK